MTRQQRDLLRPEFLVIGGMKCASTTMHHDLSCHPSVSCAEKELSALTLPTLQATLDAYQNSFRDADNRQLLGEVSTAYSMLPKLTGIASRASQITPDMKIIYVVRDPLKRAISHHQHMINWSGEGKMDADINIAIKSHPELIDYSRYSMQLEPWIDAFGEENILVLRFEDYVAQRNRTANEVFQFLGLESMDLSLDNEGLNRGTSRRYAGRFTLQLYRSSLFKNLLKPLTPVAVRTQLRQLLLRKAKASRIAPNEETVDRILDGVRDDMLQLQNFLGRNELLWDLARSRTEVLERAVQS